ncbi:MAG TPA: shikimate dehydrogenase [Dehalococcoidia bacterium]|nr:shikimate dehydrogenase [Dehalococcoidia bacterium]
MKRVGVIGYPLGHTLSPVLQQAAFDALGIEARYEAWETPADRLSEVVATFRDEDCLGANVTVPHKQAVIPLLDELDPLAQRTGAVNTIVNRQGRLRGYNTDVAGFQRALAAAGYEPGGRRAVVLGAGGAARAVVLALLEAGAGWIGVHNRTRQRAERLVAELRSGVTGGALSVVSEGGLAEAAPEADLVVNSTSVGMQGSGSENASPLSPEQLPRRGLIVDIVYRPAETRLLREARSRGLQTLGGLPMLVYQGAAAFELWTERPAPVEVMMAAAQRALEGSGS